MKKSNSFVKTVATFSVGMLIGSATLAAAAPDTVQAVFAKFTITVDGQKQQLKNDPIVYNGTTYLPVREVANMLNADVAAFDNKAKKIELKTKGGTDVIETTMEWVPASDLNRSHGLSIVMSTETTVSYNGKDLVFPLSMYDKDSDSKVFKNKEQTASLKVEDGIMYLGSDTLQALGIQ